MFIDINVLLDEGKKAGAVTEQTAEIHVNNYKIMTKYLFDLEINRNVKYISEVQSSNQDLYFYIEEIQSTTKITPGMKIPYTPFHNTFILNKSFTGPYVMQFKLNCFNDKLSSHLSREIISVEGLTGFGYRSGAFVIENSPVQMLQDRDIVRQFIAESNNVHGSNNKLLLILICLLVLLYIMVTSLGQ